jgi:hypothetical protein
MVLSKHGQNIQVFQQSQAGKYEGRMKGICAKKYTAHDERACFTQNVSKSGKTGRAYEMEHAEKTGNEPDSKVMGDRFIGTMR